MPTHLANGHRCSPVCMGQEPVPQPCGSEHPPVQKARRYMEVHFAENVSIAKLGALVSLSPCHFARVFRRHTAVSPHAYLECIRIRNVQALLDRGHTLASAAAAAGFADQSHLTHRFKRFLGITPGEYVRQRRVQAPSDLRSRG